MIQSPPPSRYPVLRIAAITVATMAAGIAVSGLIAGAAVLAWVLAAMALITFRASYTLKP